eukprot:10562187-Heterocapsa_arctica.AAC.1
MAMDSNGPGLIRHAEQRTLIRENIWINPERVLLHCELTERSTCARMENMSIRYGMCGMNGCITCAARSSIYNGEDYQIENSAILRHWKTMMLAEIVQESSVMEKINS